MTGLLLALDETLARRGGEKPEPGEPLLHPLLLLTSPGDEDETGMHLVAKRREELDGRIYG